MASGRALIAEINEWTGTSDQLAFWWLGQAGVAIRMAGKTAYIDPYLSPHPERQSPPILEPCEVTNADFVLSTHEHDDHLDLGALRGIAAASPGAIFIAPRPCREKLVGIGVAPARIVGLNDEETHTAGKLRITAIKAKHEAFDRTAEGIYPYLGYLLRSKEFCVYHSGDTLNYEGLLTRLQQFGVGVAFLPINGRDAARFRAGCLGNLTYQEAAELAGELRVQLAVPVHYDMFASNSEDPVKFLDYLGAKFPRIASWVGAAGQRVVVTRKGRA